MGSPKILAIILVLFATHGYVTSSATLKLPPTNLGLVGYWPMDEGAGSVTKDISGNKNNGTIVGTPTWVTGKFGNALNFNGTNNYVISSNNLGISGNAVFSMCAWIKWTGGSWPVDWPSFMGSNSTGVANQGLSFTISGGRPAIDFWNNRWRASGALSVNTWYHLCGVKTAGTISTTSKIYVNGQLVSGALENVDGSPNITNAPMILGRLDATRWFNGNVDEARFYNRALSVAEVQQLYQAGAAKMNTSISNKNTSGLVGLWTFDGADTTTTTATDKSGSGNNGTLTNGPTVVSGKTGQALSFNGSSQYMTTSSATGIPIGNTDRTLSVWINPSGVGTTDMQPALWLGSSGTHNVSAIGIRTAGNFLTMTFWADELDSTTVATNGKWFHLVGTYVGATRTAKLYINGNLVASKTLASDINTPASVYMSSSPDSRRIKAVLDDARVYNRALSATEIKQLYNTGVGTQVNSAQVNTPSSSLTSGLIGYWPFNGIDISGTTAYDRSTGGQNGTLVNGPTVALGKMGQALVFNGVNQYVNIGTGANLKPSSAVTVSFWMKMSKQQNGWQAIIGPSTYTGGGYLIFIETGGLLLRFLHFVGGTEYRLNSNFAPTLNTWYHVTFVADPANLLMKSYINGAFYSSVAIPSGALTYDADPLYLAGQGVNLFNGSIDDVRVYNRALSTSEINQLYLLGK